MSSATAMYRSEKDLLRGVRREGGDLHVPKGLKMRRLHKAFLRYHDPENWPLLRATLQRMGRGDLIGNGPDALIPRTQPTETRRRPRRGGPRKGTALTQHTGLPPRQDGSRSKPGRRRKRKPRSGQ